MLTWYRLLTGGCGGAIGHNIICITTVITPSNPRTDMIQWHLFNKWGAIFAEVPPLKYLKLITLYVLYTLECIHWSVGKPWDTREQRKGLVTMDDTEASYKAYEMVQHWVNWRPFPVCPFIAFCWQFPDVVTVTFPILITVWTHAGLSVSPQNTLKYLFISAHANSAHWRWQQSKCHMTISMYSLSGL